MSESLLTDETRAGRDQLRSALTLLAKLTAGESNTHIKEAMVGALYRLRDDLPAELRAVVDPAVADYVPVWGFESDPEGAGGLQPVHISHFDLDADGRVIGLSGPRVKIVMPEEIIVKLDDMTFKPTEPVPSPLPTDVEARQDGAFVFAPSDPLTGATTAFYAASKVIEAADRWAGRTVGWGKNGQITVIPYKFVTHFFNAYFDGRDKTLNLGSLGNVDAEKGIVPYSGEVPGWEIKVENLLIDASRSRDIVAHEAGHAVLDALKPGMRYGMGMAFNEGFSDVVAFLTAFDDPDVVARVLEETGGDLSKSNEASRVAEVVGAAVSRYKNDDTSDDDQRYMRSVRSELTMKDTGLAADARDIPGMGFSPLRSPHRIGEIVSGMAYDLFVALYDQWVAAGETPEVAIATAKETVGALIVRAMPSMF